MHTSSSRARRLLARGATWAAERLTGGRLLPVLPPGVDLVHDVRRSLPNLTPRTIFDVGANVGQSALHLRRAYPDAAIYCFEPVASTFEQLRAAMGRHEAVTCCPVGMSDAPGSGVVRRGPYSVMDRLVEADVATESVDRERVERVTLDTVAGFCARHAIAHVDLLKVDTEGHDLHVLRGAAAMLADHAVGLVEVEASMNPGNRDHVPFETFRSYLEPLGYLLFRVYDQVAEWPTSRPHLRRCNPVFVSATVIEANRGRA